jgi:hypothetical protein
VPDPREFTMQMRINTGGGLHHSAPPDSGDSARPTAARSAAWARMHAFLVSEETRTRRAIVIGALALGACHTWTPLGLPGLPVRREAGGRGRWRDRHGRSGPRRGSFPEGRGYLHAPARPIPRTLGLHNAGPGRPAVFRLHGREGLGACARQIGRVSVCRGHAANAPQEVSKAALTFPEKSSTSLEKKRATDIPGKVLRQRVGLTLREWCQALAIQRSSTC